MNTNIKTNTRTKQVLRVMYIIAWIVFIGVMIKAGAILISYGVSCVNPQASKNLYLGMNLSPVREFSFYHYSLSVFFMVAVLCMKAIILFLVIKALSKVNMVNPFTIEVARVLERISYVLLIAWVISASNNMHIDWLTKTTGIVQPGRSTEEFIFMAGLVFIIAQIFRRGVEIQSENDLTI